MKIQLHFFPAKQILILNFNLILFSVHRPRLQLGCKIQDCWERTKPSNMFVCRGEKSEEAFLYLLPESEGSVRGWRASLEPGHETSQQD